MSGEGAAWGGLTIAGLPLALPLEALREVVPCRPLVPLPCAPGIVIGGLDVRGVHVAVIELAGLLGRPLPPPEGACAVLLVHEGRLLALRADSVDGVFQAAPASAVSAASPRDDALLFAGSARRGDAGSLVNLLSMHALSALPGLPWIDDPEPRRQQRDDGPGGEVLEQASDSLTSMMLLRCGALCLAIDAMCVHAALWEPRVLPSPLARGACRGVVDVNGQRIAAADLGALCGLSPATASTSRQAVVLRHAKGLVALLVDAVVEIVRVPRDALVPLPAMPLFRGMLPGDPCEGGAPATEALVIDEQALLALDELDGLASTNTGAGSPAAADRRELPGAAAKGRSLVTLRFPAQAAVPIDQVAEILPYGTGVAQFGDDAVLRRVQVLRGRSVPVLCLARLLGFEVGALTPAAAVLVVETDGGCLGFGVPALESIETAQWERSVGGRMVALVGQGDDSRTLPLLDLKALAGSISARGNLLTA